MENIGNIANKILAKNDSTNDTDRNLLLSNFLQYKVLQRVGSTGMSSYDPPLNEENNPGWDNINDNYEVVDFIWEATQNSAEDEKTKAAQLNGILEHLLHTITLIYDKTFTSWGYEDSSSQLVLAMNEAINSGYYDPTGNYGDLLETDPTAYKRIIAQEFAYWMILTGWDLKSSYAPDTSPEWTIQNPTELETNTPLAFALFNDSIAGILVNPTKDYLDALTFESIQTTTQAESIDVSIEANDYGSSNVYVIDGTQKKSLVLEIGTTYTFNHSSNHPLRFSTTSDGTHNDGSEYMNGVTTSAGVTTIEVTENTPSNLYYFCQIHAGMGADITISN
jgi:plastocyanin